MNNITLQFIRSTLKEGLAKCPEEWQMTFKRMYSHKDLDKPIDKVVDDMPDHRLDWAMTQVQNSLNKLDTEEAQ